MKYIRYLAILGSIIALLVISVPTSAAPVQVSLYLPAYYQVQGIEIFPGIDIAGNNFGATFVAQATGIRNPPNPPGGTPYTGPLYNGTSSASINYIGTEPIPGGTNTFIGGSLTLSVSQNGIRIGTIICKISYRGGQVSWGPDQTTNVGVVTTSLIIISANGVFQGMSGHTGTFVGQDNHLSGIFIAGIQVPTIGGTLTLN
jgi:hypothetical protein